MSADISWLLPGLTNTTFAKTTKPVEKAIAPIDNRKQNNNKQRPAIRQTVQNQQPPKTFHSDSNDQRLANRPKRHKQYKNNNRSANKEQGLIDLVNKQ